MYKKLILPGLLIFFLSAVSLTNNCLADTKTTETNLGVYTPKFIMLETIIKENPDDATHYINKAELHLRFFQLEEARELFKQALPLAKDETTKEFLELAILYCDLKLEEATKKLDAFIEKNPDYKKAIFIRGLISLQQGDDEKALDYFEKVIKIDMNYLEAMNQIGWIYLSQADYDKAIETFNQILYRDEYYISAIDGKAYALFKLGLYKEALPYINDVIILMPDNWGAWVSKGEIYYSKGQYYLANYCLSMAESINPEAMEVMLLKEKLRPMTPCLKNTPSSGDVENKAGDNSAKEFIPCKIKNKSAEKKEPCPQIKSNSKQKTSKKHSYDRNKTPCQKPQADSQKQIDNNTSE